MLGSGVTRYCARTAGAVLAPSCGFICRGLSELCCDGHGLHRQLQQHRLEGGGFGTVLSLCLCGPALSVCRSQPNVSHVVAPMHSSWSGLQLCSSVLCQPWAAGEQSPILSYMLQQWTVLLLLGCSVHTVAHVCARCETLLCVLHYALYALPACLDAHQACVEVRLVVAVTGRTCSSNDAVSNPAALLKACCRCRLHVEPEHMCVCVMLPC